MFHVEKYTESQKERWDKFIREESVNGTFLQSKNFLDYHPAGRFVDDSVIIKEDSNICCVIPACTVYEGDKKIFYSHKGSTYGGLVISRKYYDTHRVQTLIEVLDHYLIGCKYNEAILKITPEIFSRESPALLEYMLFLNKYSSYSELSTYINFNGYNEDILSNFKRDKRSRVKKMESEELEFKPLFQDNDIADFYDLLKINLTKYNAKPIHTLDEILEFKNQRLKKNVKFYGVFLNGVQLAGSMLFDFPEVKTIHAQNLSTDPNMDIKGIDPMVYLYYSLICEYKKQGYKNISWGISTEEKGSKLNFSLIKSKESYGSSYGCNRTFYKSFER